MRIELIDQGQKEVLLKMNLVHPDRLDPVHLPVGQPIGHDKRHGPRHAISRRFMQTRQTGGLFLRGRTSMTTASFPSTSIKNAFLYTPSLQVCEDVCDVGATDPSPRRISFGIVSQT